MDKACLAIARRMYEEGSSEQEVASYLALPRKEVSSAFEDFAAGRHQEPRLRAPVPQIDKKLYVGMDLFKEQAVPFDLQHARKEYAGLVTSDPEDGSPPRRLGRPPKGSAPRKPPRPEPPKSDKSRQDPTRERNMDGKKPCATPACSNRIPRTDLYCAQCFHAEVVGRPPVDPLLQYMGGEIR